MTNRQLVAVLAAVLFPLSTGAAHAQTSSLPVSDSLAALHFRFLGPNGNRDISVVGVPGNPDVAYFGAASGGIWKTIDGGIHFKSIFDSTDVSAVGALALAPSDPNIVWAGTGEPYIIREATALGDGVYKSTSAGKTWEHMGLEKTGHIDNIAINPKNPNIVFVCAIGQVYRPNVQRGVYRTEDGGKTWEQVLKVNDTTGCSGLSMDAQDPNTLFASTWQVTVRPWDLNSGGPDGGVYVTHDGGNTWTRIVGHGLPPVGTMIGKTAVRVAPSNGNIVYVLAQGPKTGLLYRSNDGGSEWSLVNEGDELDLRAPYYTNFTVGPDNPDILYFPSTPFLVSRNGGRTITIQGGRGSSKNPIPGVLTYIGGDTHDVWIDPKNPKRIMAANDEGGAISLNGGESWSAIVLPIAQIYRVDTNSSVPYDVVGDRQDTGGEIGPSRVLYGGGGFGGFSKTIPANAWHGFDGCESGNAVFDPVNPDIVWSGCYNGDLVRVDLKTDQSRNVSVWPVATFGAPTSDVRDRWNWDFPIAISPFNHNQVFAGSQYVYETTDGGQHWKRISPDLTTDKHLGSSGGLTVDNLMTFSSATLSVIAESSVKSGVIWTGSYDGQVNVTRDGGAHWMNVTPKAFPPFGTINLDVSPFDAGTVYISSDLKEMGNYKPYIFETTDYGKTWKDVSGDIPDSEFSNVHVVREDPARKGLLFAGTGNNIYISWDDGTRWTQLKGNFPPAPVYDLKIQPKFHDLVVATYGRGIWVLDDISPLRNWHGVLQDGRPHLFAPRPAYRFRFTVNEHQQNPNGVVVGENIPYGADLTYYLPSPSPVEITITNGSGQEVRVLHEAGRAGWNRVFWNLRFKDLLRATLLNSPPGKPWLKTPPGGRTLSVWGAPSPNWGPLVVPGTFTVAMTAGGREAGTEPLRVLPDPDSLGIQADMQAQKTLLLEIAHEIDETVGLINRFEVTRRALGELEQSLPTNSEASQLRGTTRALTSKVITLEGQLFDIRGSGSAEDSFQRTPQLYAILGSLYNNLSNTGSNLGPTSQEVTVNDLMKTRLAAVGKEADEFYQVDLAKFNTSLRSHGISTVVR